MRELMPEMWWREEEVARSTFTLPRRKVGPVIDILQWLTCYAAMVGMLSRAYPQMVSELMAYQMTIIKCCRDFEGLAWAQYDQVYWRQATPPRFILPWEQPMSLSGAPVSPAQKFRICHLFNARDGLRLHVLAVQVLTPLLFVQGVTPSFHL